MEAKERLMKILTKLVEAAKAIDPEDPRVEVCLDKEDSTVYCGFKVGTYFYPWTSIEASLPSGAAIRIEIGTRVVEVMTIPHNTFCSSAAVPEKLMEMIDYDAWNLSISLDNVAECLETMICLVKLAIEEIPEKKGDEIDRLRDKLAQIGYLIETGAGPEALPCGTRLCGAIVSEYYYNRGVEIDILRAKIRAAKDGVRIDFRGQTVWFYPEPRPGEEVAKLFYCANKDVEEKARKLLERVEKTLDEAMKLCHEAMDPLRCLAKVGIVARYLP